MIKLVACDLDGTLFNSKVTISDENIAAIRAAQDNGIEFLIATGRAPKQSRAVIRNYGLRTGFININGALVYDENDTLQVKHALPKQKVIAAANILRKHNIYFEIVTADHIYSEDISKRVFNLAHSLITLNPKLSFKQAVAISGGSNAMLNMTWVNNFEQLLRDPEIEVMKIIGFDSRGPALLTKIKQELALISDLAITSSSAINIEINDSHAKKGTALLDYAKKKGIKRDEVAAIGDNLNDESMIRDAGVGVAMGNAVPKIKELAQIETKTNNEDGVGYILRKFIKDNAKE
ncbi:Cof-type HAD-IIB family hydrolase [Lactobacillus sp. ESL0701]|uniref:Cof-type HAD-IIB family hydrolase n=1 Tax=Lactobacillus sp. ESL0701 TaxID=2983217 RepID=UPI0023F647E1|nr:Cof-type HAD-IIB family hydrolase [Lactobacillus sp. ESL0701]MDF7672391.1 Cof-type HAD-IIB family hydrolase [Lactobacillus sp. ESL0701]